MKHHLDSRAVRQFLTLSLAIVTSLRWWSSCWPFAGGGILTNISARMVPEGLRDAGAATVIAVAVGFGLSFALVEILGGH